MASSNVSEHHAGAKQHEQREQPEQPQQLDEIYGQQAKNSFGEDSENWEQFVPSDFRAIAAESRETQLANPPEKARTSKHTSEKASDSDYTKSLIQSTPAKKQAADSDSSGWP